MYKNTSFLSVFQVLDYQKTVLRVLSNKIDDFYLAGGTALSLFYFQHRISLDLDFFTSHFSVKRIGEIVSYLEDSLRKRIELIAQNLKGKEVKMLIYNIYFSSKDILRIDFVEDALKLINLPRITDGIKILSLEDIYLRKIQALAGVIPPLDEIGRKKFLGGRSEAKDFYDLYFLSHTFLSLSKFVDKYCDSIVKEGLIRWFHSYDRMQMMDDILTLDTDKDIDYKILERHFKREIDKIIEKSIERI